MQWMVWESLIRGPARATFLCLSLAGHGASLHAPGPAVLHRQVLRRALATLTVDGHFLVVELAAARD